MKVPLFVIVLAIAASSVFARNTTTIHIALRSNEKGIEWLKNYVLNYASNPDSPRYGNYLSTELIDTIVQPPPHKIKRVERWLRCQDINEYQIHGDLISFTTDKYFDPVIPRQLKDVIQFVSVPRIPKSTLKLRLHTTRQRESRATRKRTVGTNQFEFPGQTSLGIVGREVIMRLYNVTGGGYVHKDRTSMGAMEFQGHKGFSQSDMMHAQANNNVPPDPVAQDHLIGINDNKTDVESELDMSVIWWSSANASLWYESYDGWMFDWAASFLLRATFPQVVSMSYAWNEKDQCSEIISCPNGETSQEYIARTNNEFMKIAARGTTILAASGDAGSPGRSDPSCTVGATSPAYPASSDWLISVGGSYVASTHPVPHKWTSKICKIWGYGCTMGTTEQMSTYNETTWTSGAGFGWWTSTPKWQQSHVEKYLSSGVLLPEAGYFNPKGRAYPDVTAVGHFCSLYDSIFKNEALAEDGTSCSAPVWAGIIANLNDFQQSRGKPVLGFANPVLYRMYEDSPSTFNEIYIGNSSCTESRCCNHNYGFRGVKGMWDAISGLGSPNVGNMKAWLLQNT